MHIKKFIHWRNTTFNEVIIRNLFFNNYMGVCVVRAVHSRENRRDCIYEIFFSVLHKVFFRLEISQFLILFQIASFKLSMYSAARQNNNKVVDIQRSWMNVSMKWTMKELLSLHVHSHVVKLYNNYARTRWEDSETSPAM